MQSKLAHGTRSRFVTTYSLAIDQQRNASASSIPHGLFALQTWWSAKIVDQGRPEQQSPMSVIKLKLPMLTGKLVDRGETVMIDIQS